MQDVWHPNQQQASALQCFLPAVCAMRLLAAECYLYLCLEGWSLPGMACLAYSVFSSANVKFRAKKPLNVLPSGSTVLHLPHIIRDALTLGMSKESAL